MRVLSCEDISQELERLNERFHDIRHSDNLLLNTVQDFYADLNKALGAFEDLELSIKLNESLNDCALESFIKSLSADVGKVHKAVVSNVLLSQKDEKRFKKVVINIRNAYNFFLEEFANSECKNDKKIRQLIWLMKQSVYSLNENIKLYNEKWEKNLEEIF